MNLLNQAAKLGGVQMTTGTYISITEAPAKQMWMDYLKQAEQRILDERAKRREGLREIATLLVLTQRIDSSTIAQINKAFATAGEVDHINQLVNESHYGVEVDTTYAVSANSSWNGNAVKSQGYQRLYVRSGKTNDELGSFLIKHGAYAYSKKLKSLGDLIAATQMSMTFGAGLNVDIATLSSVEFINSTAFDRYNSTYKALIDQALDATKNEKTIEEISN